MKPPYELDDGWVVAETEPEVPSQSSHIGPDKDDPSPMSLRLMADGEGDETTKAELDHSRIIEVGHDGLKMERRAEFQCKLKIRRLDDLKEEPPRGTWRNGCLISVVGPEDDAAPFLFFEAGTAVFLPSEDDIVPALKS
ncbi:hypothetical protein GOBAR_AA17054 [Gossypium barbadense]|uniref:Uncharacterized protein n=1 Tax=Gossypium barbadense TaxID=3634 RepID=A0A2P5XJT8_GOSBA|nr:hypothetical protein GOBAR_AA17054 [Gossypium barbadense]